jgi:hypothetical protein
MTAHYLALFASYAAAIGAWWLVSSTLDRAGHAPPSWRANDVIAIDRPWREVAIALVGAIGVIAMGQAWSRGWLLPARGSLAPLLDALDQVLIFAPLLVLPLVRRQGSRSMLVPKERVLTRLAVGVALACVALCAYAVVRDASRGPLALAARIARFENAGIAMQVLCEDVAIGILLYRLAAAVGHRRAAFAVAALFAVGHVPAIVSRGGDSGEIARLGLDFALSAMTVGTVLRSGDVLWFWPVHFALDMTQFARVTGISG